jgi:two-component system LytT family response regulator
MICYSTKVFIIFHKEIRPVLARYKLSEILELFLKEFFARIHPAYIVDFKYVETVKKLCVVINANKIPIGSNYIEGFFAVIDEIVKKKDNKI